MSTRGHYSIKKTANLLGLGEENVLNIPVDENNRVDIDKLTRKIRSLSRPDAERTKIIAIVGIAGTTETGNVDDLQKLGKIAREAGTHFHVDACWGGRRYWWMSTGLFFEGLKWRIPFPSTPTNCFTAP